MLYLTGDALWYFYVDVLSSLPYPSAADVAYLLRYGAFVVGLCWLVRSRQHGRDRAAFLDAAIVSSAFALLATVFLIVPAAQGGGAPLLSRVVSAAYPIGDVLVLVVLLQLIASREVRNVSLLSFAGGLVVLLGLDTLYTLIVASGAALPWWSAVGYLAPYLLTGFAAMHPSSVALAVPTAHPRQRPTGAKVAILGAALLLSPCLLVALHFFSDAALSTLPVAVFSAVSAILVLLRLLDLLRTAEQQSLLLSTMARTDGLTGIANRRSWDYELQRAIEDAKIEDAPLTVVFMDLDKFKDYNDTHGHLAGDRVLHETASAWHRLLGGRGFVARYGGEEFAVLISQTSAAGAEPLLHRLHQSVAGGQTCSLGVVEWQDGEGPEQVTARADQALYAAKRAGRNRIGVHDRTKLRFLETDAKLAIPTPRITSAFQPTGDDRTGIAPDRPLEPTAARCCGWDRRVVPVAMHEQAALAIEICDLCAGREWILNGQPISSGSAANLAHALDAIAAA